jgi:hypothetical protein
LIYLIKLINQIFQDGHERTEEQEQCRSAKEVETEQSNLIFITALKEIKYSLEDVRLFKVLDND